MSNPQTYNQSDKRFWLGILFVIIGGVWLLDNLDLIPYYIDDYFINWKTFLILIGLYLMFGRKKVEAGIIMIAVGTVFLLDDFDFFNIRDLWHLFWPLVVIIIGISLILRRSYSLKKKE